MNKFIKVTEISFEDKSLQKIRRIAVSTIANYGDGITSRTNEKYTSLVYKNTGLINSRMYTRETAEEIDNLINNA